MCRQMRQLLLCFQQPKNGDYKGGVSTVITHYLQNAKSFETYGYLVSLYSYSLNERWRSIFSRKTRVILSAIGQTRKTIKELKKNGSKDAIFHIHSSREFLFLKDVLLATLLRKKFPNLKINLTIHVGDIETVYNRIGFFRKKSVDLLNKVFNHVFFLDNEIREQFISEGLRAELSSVLYNFHTLESSSNVAPYNSSDEKTINLIFIGAIHKEKGVMELLDAVRNMDERVNYHLDICGIVTDPSIEDEFVNRTDKNDRIAVHGYVVGREKQELIENADVLILPSYHEGMPLVILEALAGGCAIISTKVGASKEILVADQNVKWVDVGDSVSLKNAIEEFYFHRDYLQKMKMSNFRLREEYSIDKHIAKLCQAYDFE